MTDKNRTRLAQLDAPPVQRKFIWFWAGVVLVSLLLTFGRHAPFYRLFYALPYTSTIRNPTKFLHVLSWALVILFGYGVHGLWRRYVEISSSQFVGLSQHLKNWWAKAPAFDRKWIIGNFVLVGASVIAWLMRGSAGLRS